MKNYVMVMAVFMMAVFMMACVGPGISPVSDDGGSKLSADASLSLPLRPPDGDGERPVVITVYQERFESWTNESTPVSWSVYNGAPWANIIRSPAGYQSSTAMALVSDAATPVGVVSSLFQVHPGTEYRASFRTSLPYANPDPNAGVLDHFRVMIHWRRADGSCATNGGQWCLVNDWAYTDDVHTDTSFVEHDTTFIVPNDATQALLWIYNISADLQIIDNISLTMVEYL